MSKKLFDKDNDFMDDFDEMDIDAEDLGNNSSGKKSSSKVLIPVAIAGAIALLFGATSLGLSAYQNAKLQKEFDKTVQEYINSADVNMADKIEDAIDAYAMENQPTNLTDLVGEEGAKELMDSIISDLGESELTDTQKEQLKSILVDLFSKDGALTVSGKAIFNDESKEYLTKLITEELGKTLVEYYGEGSDVESLIKKYDSLEASVKKIISEQTGNANITYSLTDNDRENIKKAVISSLGNLQGKDGAAGKDGRDGNDGRDGSAGKDGNPGKDGINGKDGIDGRDGRDGKDGANGRDGNDGKDGSDGKDGINGRDGRDGVDGKTPVKGIDYFTDGELNYFVKTVEYNVKDYFDSHELDEIAAMTESIKADVLEVFNQSADTLGDDLKDQEKEISNIGSALGTDETGSSENSNVYNNTTIYKKGDIIVRGGKIYQCKEDMEDAGEWDASLWDETDLVTVNNYYNTLISEKEDEMRDDYTGLVGSLEKKIEELVNKVVSGLTQSIEDTNSQTNERLENLENDTNSKLDNMENSAGSRMDAMESDTNSKLDSMQNDTNSKLDSMQNDTNSKLDSMKNDTDQKFGDMQADTDGKLSALGNTVEEKITNLSSSVNTVIQNFKDWTYEKFEETDKRMENIESMQTTYELMENGDGTYTLKITDPKTLN